MNFYGGAGVLSVIRTVFLDPGHEKRRREQLKWSLACRLYIESTVYAGMCSSEMCMQEPSDSELEERITKIIAEEDMEIINQHSYSCGSSSVPAVPLPPTSVRPSAGRPVCDKTNSSSTWGDECSDIDDDEVHRLLGVD